MKPTNQVLVVDDEAGMRAALEASFRRHGWQVETAGGTAEAVAKFRRGQPPLVVTDVRMPDGDGLQVMRQVRALAPSTAVILLTAFGNIGEAVQAMKSGACDYLVKPISFEQLQQSVERVMAAGFALPGAGQETALPEHGEKAEPLVGHSPALLRVLQRARQVAGSDADILIEAESGTGKELLARLIHHASPRRARPFVAVNCAAFPETLLESELFGHVRGAFTGATVAKPGKFELANGGTLLLDEVGEMPLSLQPKLLRVLQEREVDRLGDTRSVPIDIRIIATSNRPLYARVQEGQFRADLYYRLQVIPLSLPPLRQRREDIRELAEHFARLYAARAGCPPPRLSAEFVAGLEQHGWPGNVRELANCIHRSLALGRGPELGREALEEVEIIAGPRPGDTLEAGLSLRELEKRLLERTLEATAGNRSRAAEMMGVSLRTIRNKIRDYGLPARSMYEHD